MVRTILLPEWNDLPDHIRMALVDTGDYWDVTMGGDLAVNIYNVLRSHLNEHYFDPEIEPRLFPDEPNVLRRTTDGEA